MHLLHEMLGIKSKLLLEIQCITFIQANRHDSLWIFRVYCLEMWKAYVQNKEWMANFLHGAGIY